MRYVVSYDIGDDKRRRLVAKIMEGYGYRVQYSVFECDLEKRQLLALKKALRPLVKKQEMDSVRFYALPADTLAMVEVFGNDMARSLGIISVI